VRAPEPIFEFQIQASAQSAVGQGWPLIAESDQWGPDPSSERSRLPTSNGLGAQAVPPAAHARPRCNTGRPELRCAGLVVDAGIRHQLLEVAPTALRPAGRQPYSLSAARRANSAGLISASSPLTSRTAASPLSQLLANLRPAECQC